MKLLKHDRKRYDGYTLNFLGYDYLAFSALSKRNAIRGIGRQIGVGKESDVYMALDGTEDKQVHQGAETYLCFWVKFWVESITLLSEYQNF